jgi:uncharacterized protein (DUF2062 family)
MDLISIKQGNGLETAKNKLIEFLKMGMTPERLALCIGLGIALGLVPALGTTTLLCTLAAFLFRLNLPAIQLVNYFVYPLQLALLIPFIRAGEWLFGVESLNLSLVSIQRRMKADLWETVISLWSATIRAVMVWLLIAPVIVALVYLAMTPLLKKLKPERLTVAS